MSWLELTGGARCLYCRPVDYVVHGIVAAVSSVLVLFGSGVFIIQMQVDHYAPPQTLLLLNPVRTCADRVASTHACSISAYASNLDPILAQPDA